MDLISFLEQYGFLAYGILLFFGGRWGVKFFNLFTKKVYNFLLFSTVFGLIFVLVEASQRAFTSVDIMRYLITYTVVTSCYENLVNIFPFLKSKSE